MIGKIEKAKRYAEERTRIHITNLAVTFDGENSEHRVTFDGHKWHCDCGYFHTHSVCSHTMALERVLAGMVPQYTELS
ncbi:MAG TPA: hypothetical protein VMT34_15895 [Aggregatilineales bacterium]|nr:hypothetical protein [Aggregatilineales bacterium]